MKTWLDKWEPENEEFWKKTGSKIAWKTLTITTLSLILSFASWFMMSVIAVKLPGLGFPFSKEQLFWLVAIPGLAAGFLRITHLNFAYFRDKACSDRGHFTQVNSSNWNRVCGNGYQYSVLGICSFGNYFWFWRWRLFLFYA